jgi:DNA-binding beta-propeller fold protein YncE
MQRRKFLNLAAGSLALAPWIDWTRKDELIIGHGDFRYTVDVNWGALNAQFYPVKDCHEMVIDRKGRIILITNHVKNNILIYDQSGNLLDAWGTSYPGAHGLSLKDEGGEEFLYITDTSRHEVIKTDLQGREVLRLPAPVETQYYEKPEAYLPTETAIADNGDIYVADGYGRQYILHYNAKGELLHVFGGRGSGVENFDNAHGICIDQRSGKDQLLITARQQNRLKVFSMEGEHQESIDLPGAYICRPVVHGEQVYLATIWSGDGSANTGFISILDEKNQLVSAPGGAAPRYQNDELQKMYQTLQIFKHPHDVCIDADENIYVAQWNAGATYPIKLKRV